MTHSARTEDAVVQMARITAHLKVVGSATCKQLAAALTMNKSRPSILLNELRGDGIVKCDHARPANWSLGCDREYIAHLPGSHPSRRTVTSWDRGHPAPHDALAHLFGMAGARASCG